MTWDDLVASGQFQWVADPDYDSDWDSDNSSVRDVYGDVVNDELYDNKVSETDLVDAVIAIWFADTQRVPDTPKSFRNKYLCS